MRKSGPLSFFDALYGECTLAPALAQLARTPVMQRLREVRLSNIDSLSSPGVANVSRFEHSLGTAHLASCAGFSGTLNTDDALVLQAACLLHDSAMQPFGHLVEEALKYLGFDVPHEERWRLLLQGGDAAQVGGFEHFQIYMGLEAGLTEWASLEFGSRAPECLAGISAAIAGNGRLGKAVCGAIDLDNLDNVVRAAYHMGIRVDPLLPTKIARDMVAADATGIVFAENAVGCLQQWLQIRADVYDRFMLSRPDFAGKLMLISATTEAVACDCLNRTDWVLTDREYLDRLSKCPEKSVREPVVRWLTGDLWAVSDLLWMESPAPSYPAVYEFSKQITERLKRQCLAYRIKDKRTRNLQVRLGSNTVVGLGSRSSNWLLGVGSSIREPFSRAQNAEIRVAAKEFFGSDLVGSEQRRAPRNEATLPFDLFQPA